MENIIFKNEQYVQMINVQKTELIIKCITSISGGGTIIIDDKEYTDLSSFISWLVG